MDLKGFRIVVPQSAIGLSYKWIKAVRKKLVSLSYIDSWLEVRPYLLLCFLVETAFWRLTVGQSKISSLASYTEIDSFCKHSETVYIIGTAPCINSISRSGTRILEQAETIGLNTFFLHDINPTYLSLELPSLGANEVLQLVEKRYQDSMVKVIINKYHANFSDLRNFKRSNDIFYSVSTIRFSDYSAKALQALYEFRYHCNFLNNIIIHNGGSLTIAIMLASRIAKRRIVLVGIELFGNTNYYQEPESKNTCKNYPEMKRQYQLLNNMGLKDCAKIEQTRFMPGSDIDQLHATATATNTLEYNEHPVQESIKALKKALAKQNINLEVASHTSLLLNILDKAVETSIFYPDDSPALP